MAVVCRLWQTRTCSNRLEFAGILEDKEEDGGGFKHQVDQMGIWFSMVFIIVVHSKS